MNRRREEGKETTGGGGGEEGGGGEAWRRDIVTEGYHPQRIYDEGKGREDIIVKSTYIFLRIIA